MRRGDALPKTRAISDGKRVALGNRKVIESETLFESKLQMGKGSRAAQNVTGSYGRVYARVLCCHFIIDDLLILFKRHTPTSLNLI